MGVMTNNLQAVCLAYKRILRGGSYIIMLDGEPCTDNPKR